MLSAFGGVTLERMVVQMALTGWALSAALLSVYMATTLRKVRSTPRLASLPEAQRVAQALAEERRAGGGAQRPGDGRVVSGLVGSTTFSASAATITAVRDRYSHENLLAPAALLSVQFVLRKNRQSALQFLLL